MTAKRVCIIYNAGITIRIGDVLSMLILKIHKPVVLDQKSLNIFSYCYNNPINDYDKMGLTDSSQWQKKMEKWQDNDDGTNTDGHYWDNNETKEGYFQLEGGYYSQYGYVGPTLE